MMWRRLAKWYHVREGYWFAPKLFGYGATPVTWQGWLLSFGLMLLLIAAIRFIPSDPARFTVAASLVLAFCVIAARNTDGGWRSEERRGGKECVSTCRSRCSQYK